MVDSTLIVPPNDTGRVEELLAADGDVAAVILEPTGATFGQIPTGGDVLHRLREATARHGVLLIFDEVISGFRCSAGGAQGYYGVTPDLTTLAKIVGGGLPAAAVAGRADVLRVLDYREENGRIQPPPVVHQGTHNASPISGAAGIATRLKPRRQTPRTKLEVRRAHVEKYQISIAPLHRAKSHSRAAHRDQWCGPTRELPCWATSGHHQSGGFELKHQAISSCGYSECRRSP